MYSKTSRLLFRNNSISDASSIRGAGEVPSFRLSEAIEGVTESLPPPLLKAFPMSLSKFMQLRLRWLKFSRIQLTRQRNRTYHLSSLTLNPAPQIGHRATLANKVVDQKILVVPLCLPCEPSLARQATEAAGAGVPHNVALDDACFIWQLKMVAQEFRQGAGDGIHPVLFICMGTYQDRKHAFAGGGNQVADGSKPQSLTKSQLEFHTL